MNKRIISVFGTRPEAIKMAPLVQALASAEDFESSVCVTAQHRYMLDQVLDLFSIKPDFDFDLMRPGQDLVDITSRTLRETRSLIRSAAPDLLLVHGDTTTCFAVALAAFYEGIKIGHVEAGLRTYDLKAPFPEEFNRSVVDKICDFHFAPTETARENLLQERVDDRNIWVTGNTVIDALYHVRDLVDRYDRQHWESVFGNDLVARVKDPSRKLILVTGHRRENFGDNFRSLCQAIRDLSIGHLDWDIIYPVHLNPNVQKPVRDILSEQDNVHLIDPLEYEPFIWLMNRCDIILTDSGGIQEEGPALGKPVLVMRDVTERPEAVDAGTVELVGADRGRIVARVEALFEDADLYDRMSNSINPYGDGRAVERIVSALRGIISAGGI